MRRGLALALLLATAPAIPAAAQNTANPQYQLTGKDYRTEAVEIQQMFYNVAGAVKATNSAAAAAAALGGVTQLAAGTDITLTPASGTGVVTISAAGTSGVTGISSSCAAGFYLSTGTWVNGVTKGGGCVAIPTSLPPSGAAGGALTGTYPNPTIAVPGISTGAVTTAALTGNGQGPTPLGVASSSVAVLSPSGYVNNFNIDPASVTKQGFVSLSNLGGAAPAARVDLSTVDARFNLVAVSTAQLRLDAQTTAVSTTALSASTVAIAALDFTMGGSTNTLRSDANKVATSTTALSVSTVAIRAIVDDLGVDTATFAAYQGTTSIVVFNLGASTQALSDAVNLKVSKSGDAMTGALRLYGSSMTVDNDGFGQSNGVAADSMTLVDAFGHSVFVGNKLVKVVGSSSTVAIQNTAGTTLLADVQVQNATEHSIISQGGARFGCATLTGSCGVGLIGADGKIPALSSTYFASVAAGGVLAGSYPNPTLATDRLNLDGSNTLTGDLNLNKGTVASYSSIIFKDGNSPALDYPLGEIDWRKGVSDFHRIISVGENDTAFYAGELLIGGAVGAPSAQRGVHIVGAGPGQNYDLFVSSWGYTGISTGTPRATLDVNGFVNVAASVTAGAGFYGDGSHLTGIGSGGFLGGGNITSIPVWTTTGTLGNSYLSQVSSGVTISSSVAITGALTVASSFTVTSTAREIILSTSASYSFGDSVSVKVGQDGRVLVGGGSSASLARRVLQTFSASGATTFTVPAGVYTLLIKAWGAGGGGGDSYGGGGTAGGGGGGAYVWRTVGVTPGQVLNVFVGNHAVAGAAASPAGNGGAGTGSFIGSGGNGGGASSTNNGNGGGGGSASGVYFGSTPLVVAPGGGGGGGAGSASSGANADGTLCTIGTNCSSTINGVNGSSSTFLGGGFGGGGGGGYTHGGAAGQLGTPNGAGTMGDYLGDGITVSSAPSSSGGSPGGANDPDYNGTAGVGGRSNASTGTSGEVVILTPSDSMSINGVFTADSIVTSSFTASTFTASMSTISVLVVTSSITYPASIRTVVPKPMGSFTSTLTAGAIGALTTGVVGLEYVPQTIRVSTITYNATISTPGTFKICVYDEDNTTKLIDVTSLTNKTGLNYVTVSPAVTLQPGNYYFLVGWATTATSTTLDKWTTVSEPGFNATPYPGGKVFEGTIAGRTSGACDATIQGTITGAIDDSVYIRLDQ